MNIRSIGKQSVRRLHRDKKSGGFHHKFEDIPTWAITRNRKRVGIIRETTHPNYRQGGYYKKLTAYRLKSDGDIDSALSNYKSIAEAKKDLWFYRKLRTVHTSLSHLKHPEWGFEDNIPNLEAFTKSLSKVINDRGIEPDIEIPAVYGLMLRSSYAENRRV